ncbi:MAG: LLM class flavin-dependent oxidoreductase [Actinomycetota bacterium]|nr:LLM class flavin-dependent oxidoreductase [Actinomycetota bacterium]
MTEQTPPGVTLGLVLPPYDEPERIFAAARLAEAHNFHSVWATDATLPGYPWLDGLAVIGGVIAVTERVQVGTSILVAARRNPVLLAHTLASLDYLSGGRFIFGVGVAERALRPNEFTVAGVPIERRGRITDEFLELIPRLWSESSVTHQGEFFQGADITIEPKPVRPGGIPIWVGGRVEESLRRAAKVGSAWMPTLISPDDFRTMWPRLGEKALEAGRDPASIEGAVYLFGTIGPSYEAARGILAPSIEAIFRSPFEYFESFCMVGTSEQWLEQIGRFKDAGARHVNVLLYTNDLLSDVEQIGNEVASVLQPIAL